MLWDFLYRKEIKSPYTKEELAAIRRKTSRELMEIMKKEYETEDDFFDAILKYMAENREACGITYPHGKGFL